MKALLAIASVLLTACSSAPPTDPPSFEDEPPRATRKSGAAPAPTLTADPSASPDPLPPPTPAPSSGTPTSTWSGTLASTTRVDFGGDPYCAYRVRFENVSVGVTADKSGNVVAASVEADAVEEAVPPCPNAPLPRQNQMYRLDVWGKTGTGGTRLVLVPAKKNTPQASLVLDVDLSSPSAPASLAWHRIDASAPLDWRVNATVALTSM